MELSSKIFVSWISASFLAMVVGGLLMATDYRGWDIDFIGFIVYITVLIGAIPMFVVLIRGS